MRIGWVIVGVRPVGVRRRMRLVWAAALLAATTAGGTVVAPDRAVAASPCTALLCVLDATAQDALYVHPGTVQVSGAILVNSTNSRAARVVGSGAVSASGTISGPAAPAGFATVGNGSYSPTPTTQPAALDPFAAVPTCPASTACPATPVPPFTNVTLTRGGQTINPGVYGSITVSGGARLTLNPGTYVITTRVSVTGSGTVLTGSGVTLYLACATYPVGCAVAIAGASYTAQTGAKVTVTAPASGAFAGLSIISDRNNTASITTTGTGASTTADGVYAAAGTLATASATVNVTRAVVGKVNAGGGGLMAVTPATGMLALSAPATASLGSAPVGDTITATLGAVTVSDLRDLVGGSWTATVTATTFVSGTGGPARTIDTSRLSFWSGPAVATSGTATFTPGQPTAGDAVPLTSPRTAFTVTGQTGATAATWNPTLVIATPTTLTSGTYTGTITYSVA
ncbi:hypothetical protein MXD63_15770 [Frankia sp. Cpl3]|nr:hypothetical protein [Frankia sp. Cpl3]